MIPDHDQYDPDEIADGFHVVPDWDLDEWDDDEWIYLDVTDVTEE